MLPIDSFLSLERFEGVKDDNDTKLHILYDYDTDNEIAIPYDMDLKSAIEKIAELYYESGFQDGKNNIRREINNKLNEVKALLFRE